MIVSFRCKLLRPDVDYETRNVIARSMITDGNYRQFYDAADKDKDYDITIKTRRDHRSLDANAYYHVLLNKIATAMGVSMNEVKNMTLSRYGQLALKDGRPVEFLIPEDEDVSMREDVHLKPTDQLEFITNYDHDNMFRWHQLVRGSHTYDTAEMTALISGTISEAREAGLTDAEIMTPNERKQLNEVYGLNL